MDPAHAKELAQLKQQRAATEAEGGTYEQYAAGVEANNDPAATNAFRLNALEARLNGAHDPEPSNWQQLDEAHAQADEQPARDLDRWLVNWEDLWAAADSGPEWLLEPLIARGRAHALYAGAKSGKSFLMLHAAARLACGDPFLLQGAGEPVDVLYVDYEMTEDDLRDRLAGFGFGPETDLSRLHYILLPSIPGLDTAAGADYVIEAAERHKAELVIIDTTARAVAGKENDADTYNAFYRHTGLALKRLGCAWVRLDHSGKDLERGQRGSSGKNDDVDVVWQYVRTETGAALKATHKRMGWVPDVLAVTIAEDDDGIYSHQVAVADRLWPAGTKELAALLDELEVPVDMGRRAVRKALKGAGTAVRNDVLGATLRWRRDHLVNMQVNVSGTTRGPVGTRVPRHSGDHPHTLVWGVGPACPREPRSGSLEDYI